MSPTLSIDREHTVRLRQLGLDMAADLPADFAARLDEYAAIQAETGLLRIDETSLEQWYQDRKLDIINLAECSAAGRADCRRLEAQLANVTAETAELEALLAAADGDGASAAETGRRMVKLDKEIADSRHKLVRHWGREQMSRCC